MMFEGDARRGDPGRPLAGTVRWVVPSLLAVLLLGSPASARAELPEARALLVDIGLSTSEIEEVESGSFVNYSVRSTSDREISTGLAFRIAATPSELIDLSRQGLMGRIDPNMISHGSVSNPAKIDDFAELELPAEQAKAYLHAEPGGDLNLSSEELARFRALARNATTEDINAVIRKALVERASAYQSRGLAGLAPYDLGNGKQRKPSQELDAATRGARYLSSLVPVAYEHLLEYPKAEPPGTEEIFRWSYFKAHGEPTIVLSHLFLMPDGDAWILANRQYYVSTGYNTTQEIVGFLPTKAGTVVVYSNRTSTDQVTGFGGGAKRSIGSKLLVSQLEDLFERVRKTVK